MDKLQYALDDIEGKPFERFVADFLRQEGYNIHESGRTGTDGGWDGRVTVSDKEGIYHASTEQRPKSKLRHDAERVADLEDRTDENFDLFLFVTNQNVTGEQEIVLEDEIEADYGWDLQIIHRDNILGKLRTEYPNLADTHLGYNPAGNRDAVGEFKAIQADRLNEIRDRDGPSSILPDGPAVTVHVIPFGYKSQTYSHAATELPAPPVLKPFSASQPEPRGSYKLTVSGANNIRLPDLGYGYLDTAGLYESVDVDLIREGAAKERVILTNPKGSDRPGLNAEVVIAVRHALDALDEMGFTNKAMVSVSLVDAKGTVLQQNDKKQRFGHTPALTRKTYSTTMRSVPLGEPEVIEYLEPILSEVWRELGEPEGTPAIEDGAWAFGPIRFGTETALDTGDR